MLLEQNKAIVIKFYQAFDKKDVEQGKELISSHIVGRGMGTDTLKGYDAFMQYGMMMFAAFPDGCHILEEVIAEDDKVVTRGIFIGTHQGELMGIPATGRQVNFSVVHIDRVVDGKIVEHWGQGDLFAMMQQLGVVSPPQTRP
ncbi:ester cyclase [Candidatus Gracilibacteria bacterium]|nr:ester cyclase [Candidatus Gracilibacteria bacterium]NJM89517.1 ester cyclase [Hydrococcus sp. RU_2_2]NJP20766.1 ester cyclase [Hydrococcus sp. CRU_1_1]